MHGSTWCRTFSPRHCTINRPTDQPTRALGLYLIERYWWTLFRLIPSASWLFSSPDAYELTWTREIHKSIGKAIEIQSKSFFPFVSWCNLSTPRSVLWHYFMTDLCSSRISPCFRLHSSCGQFFSYSISHPQWFIMICSSYSWIRRMLHLNTFFYIPWLLCFMAFLCSIVNAPLPSCSYIVPKDNLPVVSMFFAKYSTTPTCPSNIATGNTSLIWL